jgi:hypothetical protein
MLPAALLDRRFEHHDRITLKAIHRCVLDPKTSSTYPQGKERILARSGRVSVMDDLFEHQSMLERKSAVSYRLLALNRLGPEADS